MADPLSIVASVLAIIGAARNTAKGIEKLRCLHNAPEELECVLNEISDIGVVLKAAQSALTVQFEGNVTGPLDPIDYDDISRLVQRCKSEVTKLEDLVNHDLKSPSGNDANGRPRVSNLRWIMRSGQLKKIQERLRNCRESLTAVLVGSLFNLQQRIRLDIQEVSIVTQVEHDRNLVRMDHPQAIPLQRALEELLSREPPQLPTVEQQGHEDPHHQNPLEVPAIVQENSPLACGANIPEDPPACGESVSLRITATLPRESCGPFCQCQCHIHTQVRIPHWLTAVVGTMFGSYRGTPTFARRPCNYAYCARSGKTSSHFTYYFPARLINAVFTFSSTWKDVTGRGGSWTVSMPELISPSDPVWSVLLLDDERDILSLFSKHQASPLMVNAADGTSMLWVAINHWKIKTCEFCLKGNADRYIKSKTGSSPTELAWTRILSLPAPDKAEKVSELRTLFSEEDVFDNMGFTDLHMIVTGLKNNTLESVLENDTSRLNKPDARGKTPLIWASARGDCSKVKTLLEYGASMTMRDNEGRCALSWAVWSGSSGCTTCVKLLLENGAQPNVRDTRAGESPLHWALKGASMTAAVIALLEHGADTTCVDDRSSHPLHRAALTGALQSARVLLDRGADIEAWWNPGTETPLFTAVRYRKPELISLFLGRGASVTARHDGRNLLHYAAQQSDTAALEIIASFPLRGITADDTDAKGSTAWEIFERERQNDVNNQFMSNEQHKQARVAFAKTLELGKFC